METNQQPQPKIALRMVAKFSDIQEIEAELLQYKKTQDELKEMGRSVVKHIESLRGELKALADKAVANSDSIWEKIDEALLAKNLATKHEIDNGHFEINFIHQQILLTEECDHETSLPPGLDKLIESLKSKGFGVDVETSENK